MMHVGKYAGKNHLSYIRMPHYWCFTGIITDTRDFLPYMDMMTPHLVLLGTVLGIGVLATAIVDDPGDPQTKCLKILKKWMDVTPNSTWDLFCEKLGKSATFNSLRSRIAEDNNTSGATLIQDIVILMWMYVVITCNTHCILSVFL